MLKEKQARELLDKYFEGETSCAEEQQLRSFFTQVRLPEDLVDYRPIFGYLDEESRKAAPRKSSKAVRIRFVYYAVSGVAASILILLGIFTFNRHTGQEMNSAYINGEKYTDIQIVHQQARAALAEVSFSQEDIADEMLPDDIK